MLRLTRSALDQITAHARWDHPIESCGILVASAAAEVAHRVVPMANQAASPTFFRFDSREQFQVHRELEAQGEVCRAIYHSHTSSDAYPSREDILFAGDPHAHYLIVSTWALARVPIRSFRIIDGSVTEESIFVEDNKLHPQGVETTGQSQKTREKSCPYPSSFPPCCAP